MTRPYTLAGVPESVKQIARDRPCFSVPAPRPVVRSFRPFERTVKKPGDLVWDGRAWEKVA